MAFLKEKNTTSGVIGNYHRIVQTSIFCEKHNASIKVYIYKDQSCRMDNKSPLEIKIYQTAPGTFTKDNLDADNPFTLGYAWLKQHIDLYFDAETI